MLNESTLKSELKSDIQAIFDKCNGDEGMSAEEYADKMAEVIANRIVSHLKDCASVSPGTDRLAGGQYPVTGGATGKVS